MNKKSEREKKDIENTEFAKGWGMSIAQHGFLALPHAVRRKLKPLLSAPEYLVFEELLFWFQFGDYNPLVTVPLSELARDVGVRPGQVSRVLRKLAKHPSGPFLVIIPQARPKEVMTYDLTPGIERLRALAKELAAEKQQTVERKKAEERRQMLAPRLAWRLSDMATLKLARFPDVFTDGKAHQVVVDPETVLLKLRAHIGALSIDDVSEPDDHVMSTFSDELVNDYRCKLDVERESKAG